MRKKCLFKTLFCVFVVVVVVIVVLPVSAGQDREVGGLEPQTDENIAKKSMFCAAQASTDIPLIRTISSERCPLLIQQ